MRWFVSALLVFCAACTGTDVGNPPRGGLSMFDTPGCKRDLNNDKGVDPAQPAWVPDQETYRGLQCFLWDRLESGRLRIRVTNYAAGCHSNEGWEPRAVQRAAGAIDLVLESPECLAASCGWCIYDLLFELDAKATQANELTLAVQRDLDCDPNARRDEVKLSLYGRTSGVACTYANPYALFDLGATEPRDGTTERMPCGAHLTTVCAAEQSCTPLDDSAYAKHQLCLKRCSSDAECGPDGLFACKQGTCQLAQPY